MKKIPLLILAITILCVAVACSHEDHISPKQTVAVTGNVKTIIDDAIDQTHVTTHYDPSYVRIKYPNGDVPMDRGACTDVIVRAFRKAGVDLQKDVHEDMAANFAAYPHRWGLNGPDTNIDHRRVPNLMKYFERKNKSIAITSDANDYRAGDIVAWDLGGGPTHIGLVTNVQSEGSSRMMIVHNIGEGANLEDVMFNWKIIGHYRYF